MFCKKRNKIYSERCSVMQAFIDLRSNLMAAPRKKTSQSLPPNLYWDVTNKKYRYKNIHTGRFYSMGKNKEKAISAARQLNERLMPGTDLVAKVLGTQKTLNQFLEQRFIPTHLPKRKLAEKTLIEYKRQLIHIRKKLGKYSMNQIGVSEVASFLRQFADVSSNRVRSLLNIIFQYAVAEGYAHDNPVAKTMKHRTDKLRKRMSAMQFQAIYEQAGKMGLPWIQNAMKIGLITLQREEDILAMKFSDIMQESINGQVIDVLQVIQEKTKRHGDAAYIKIQIGEQLKEVIQGCRNEVVSPYLIHTRPKRIARSGNKPPNRDHHTQILQDHFIKNVQKVRDATGLFKHLLARECPSFHEIRALGIKTYEDQGIDAQKLAGHTTRGMTEAYKKGHEIQWQYTHSA